MLGLGQALSIALLFHLHLLSLSKPQLPHLHAVCLRNRVGQFPSIQQGLTNDSPHYEKD